MRHSIAVLAVCAIVAASMAVAGCDSPGTRSDKVAQELHANSKALAKLQEESQALRATIAGQQDQIRTLQQLGDRRLGVLFYVSRIELSRYTGGVNLDAAEGDDGIKVFLRPIDQDGSVIKAAGDVRIQLFDLAADPEKNLIGQYDFPAAEIARHWSSGFVSYHFNFECLWAGGPPAHDEITVRVQFTDYLTGKTFTAQKLCKVELP